MKFDYNFLLEVYNEMLDDQAIFVVITGLKFVGLCVLIVTWYGQYFNFIKDADQKPMPVNPKDIMKGIGFIIILLSYDQLLAFMDYILGFVETYYANFQVKPKDMGLETVDDIPVDGNRDWTDTLKDAAFLVQKMISDPTYSLVQSAKGIAWFIDLLIFGTFIAERFFFLGILRILGGIALAFSIHPKLSKWFWNWLGLYFAIYLLIIPYFLVNAFTNVIYEKSEAIIENITGTTGTYPGAYSPLIIVVFFIIWVKFKLFKGSRDIVYKIFN